MSLTPLSPSERNKLRETHITNFGAICLVLVMLAVGYFLFLKFSSLPHKWIAHPILAAIYCFFVYNIWNVWKDYRSGVKRKLSGTISGLKSKFVSSSSSSSGGGTYAGGRLYSSSSSFSMSSESRTIYKIKVENKWYNVPEGIFRKHKKGDFVNWYITYQTKSFLTEV